MTPTQKAAMEQALDYIDEIMKCPGRTAGSNQRLATLAHNALRAALAEQPAEQPAEQEPVAWFYEERGRRWVTDALHEAQHANDGVITPLYAAPQPRLDAAAIRAAALEEAAKLADEVGGRDRDCHAYDAAAAIRALKDKP